MNEMRKKLNKKYVLYLSVSLMIFLYPADSPAKEKIEIPQWMKALEKKIVDSFHTEVSFSHSDERDPVNGKKYKIIRIEGKGNLKNIPDPFGVMRKLFISNGWVEDLQYMADGHGSSSTGYRKGICFCIVSAQIDSSCNDEKSGHIPQKFWFAVDCRESLADKDPQCPDPPDLSVQGNQNQTDAYTHQSLLAPEEELIYLLFGSINNRQNQEAINLLSQNLNPTNETERHWLEQFNAIRSVHILDIKEISKDTWTDCKKIYKLTLEIYVDDSVSNAPIPYYGFGDNPNIRFITVVKLKNRWFIDQIGTGP